MFSYELKQNLNVFIYFVNVVNHIDKFLHLGTGFFSFPYLVSKEIVINFPNSVFNRYSCLELFII